MPGWHTTFRLVEDQTLLVEPADRRWFARTAWRIGAPRGLVGFGVADTHGHLLTLGSREDAGKLARSLSRALHHRLPDLGPFDAARIRPIRDVWHLMRAVRYVLRQDEHHGADPDPFREATSLPDLLGARWLPAAPEALARLRSAAPRLGGQLDGLLPDLDLGAPPDPLDGLAPAALRAFGLHDLRENSPQGLLARQATAALGLAVARPSAAAAAAGLGASTVRRLRPSPPPDAALEALRRQLAWQRRLGGSEVPPASSSPGPCAAPPGLLAPPSGATACAPRKRSV